MCPALRLRVWLFLNGGAGGGYPHRQEKYAIKAPASSSHTMSRATNIHSQAVSAALLARMRHAAFPQPEKSKLLPFSDGIVDIGSVQDQGGGRGGDPGEGWIVARKCLKEAITGGALERLRVREGRRKEDHRGSTVRESHSFFAVTVKRHCKVMGGVSRTVAEGGISSAVPL